jgi:hypothetical protein
MGSSARPAYDGTGREVVDVWPTAVDWSMEGEEDAHTGRHSSSPPLQSTAASKGTDPCFLAAGVARGDRDVGGEGGSSWMGAGAVGQGHRLQRTAERQVEGGGRGSSSHLEEIEKILKRLENEVGSYDMPHCQSTRLHTPTHQLVFAGARLEMFHSIRPWGDIPRSRSA